MNLKTYYQKIRDVECGLPEPFVVLVSHETPDGGKEGVLTEVPKHLAARMIADGRAHLASEEAAKEFQQRKTDAKRAADPYGTASRMQRTPVPTADLEAAKRFRKE